MGYIPARASAGMPSWLPAGTTIKLMPIDIAKVADTNSANLKRFSDIFDK
jgi:iron(III) transport system substrate-binding protein